MKLVLYGGGDERDNQMINHALIALAGKKNPLITYIPACSYDADIEFAHFLRHFKKYKTRIINFPVDISFSPILLREVLKSDVIYLGGGNTYYFLRTLKEKKLIPLLREFARNGGILGGLSAGAILMTPSIATAGFPHFDCDENDEDLSDFSSLGLVRFEFFPHYRNSRRYENELKEYSTLVDFPVYGCPDGSGIIVEDERISFFGKSWCFFKGQKMVLKAA